MNYLTYIAALALTITASGKVETWTNIEGNIMQAELVSADEKYASFRKVDGSGYLYPLSKLSDADQIRVREILENSQPKPAVTSPPVVPPAAATATAGKLTTDIAQKLVAIKSKKLAPFDGENLAGAKYYAFYFSAEWCPPCRAFTPELVKAYKSLKAKNRDFEVVFVSSDRSEEKMQGYMSDYKMPWPAIDFESLKSVPSIQGYSGNGIPNLVFVTADGKVLSSSFVDGKYVGPFKVLDDIKKKLSSGS